MLERSALPPTDGERDEAVATLRTHCADGRLTLDEFADRVAAVIQARTSGEVAAVVSDLPAEVKAVEAAPSHTTLLGIMCGARRRGRWRPAERITAFAFWGGCQIDFRGAEITTPEVRVTATAVMGGVEIIVPEGVRVEVEGLPLMGGIDRRIRDVPTLPGTPVIKVKAFAFWGGVVVHSRPSRSNEQRADRRARSFEQVAREVPAEVPPEAMPDGTVTILFSDIENFTALTEQLGDLRAQDVLRAHNELVRAQVAACGGHEVKSQGDSFMVSFAGARRGLRCAIGIQQSFAEWSAKHPDTPLRVRIGLHTGEAIREEDDLFGRSVIMAARIAAQADGGVILVSSLLKELADSSGEFAFGPPRTTELKGLRGEHVLYPVEWEAAGS